MSTYFSVDIDYVCESLVMPISFSTPVGNSLVVDRVYRGSVVIFSNSETRADLILLDMLDFDVISGIDCYVKTVTLAYLVYIDWCGRVL